MFLMFSSFDKVSVTKKNKLNDGIFPSFNSCVLFRFIHLFIYLFITERKMISACYFVFFVILA